MNMSFGRGQMAIKVPTLSDCITDRRLYVFLPRFRQVALETVTT